MKPSNEQRLRDALKTAEMAMLGYTVRNEVIYKALKDARAALAATEASDTEQSAPDAAAWAYPCGLARLARVRDGYADSALLTVNATQEPDHGFTVPLYTHPAPASQSADQVRDALTFGICGDKMYFAVGAQSFTLDYEPEDEAQFSYMSDMLTRAISRATAPAATESAEPSAEKAVTNWTALNEVTSFLMGSTPLEGVIFGERHPTKAGLFWWRLNLRAALCRVKG